MKISKVMNILDKEQLINSLLFKIRPIIESQIKTEDNIASVRLHVFTDTQIQTMNKIFSEYDKSWPLYQEALHILND